MTGYLLSVLSSSRIRCPDLQNQSEALLADISVIGLPTANTRHTVESRCQSPALRRNTGSHPRLADKFRISEGGWHSRCDELETKSKNEQLLAPRIKLPHASQFAPRAALVREPYGFTESSEIVSTRNAPVVRKRQMPHLL
jgi:hypothetical protein